MSENPTFCHLLFLIQVMLLLLDLTFAGADDISLSAKMDNRHLHNFSHWMENLPPRLHNVPLTSLAIPGSHDSCSYSVSRKSQFSPYLVEKARRILNYMDPAPAKDVVYRWSVTQSLNITEQLRSGIRYLDIRISYYPSSRKWHVVHGLIGDTFENMVQQIEMFLQQSPKEVILMDLNHIYVDKEYRIPAVKLLDATINKYLKKHLYRGESMLNNLTLGYLWQRNKQVVLFCSAVEPLKSGSTIVAPFDTKTFQDPDSWIMFLTQHYNAKRPANVFYVTQGILQPHWAEVITGIAVNASLKTWLTETANPLLVDWLKARKSGPEGINIVIADFVETDDFVPTVLALNNRSSRLLCSTDKLFMTVFTTTLILHFIFY